MVFNFQILCDENDDFVRRISIDADSTFLDLNNAILKFCGYSDDQITSFYMCDSQWKQGIQVIREEIDDEDSDEDLYIMGETALRDLIEENGQRLVFVFDPLSERLFFITVYAMEPSKHLKEAACIAEKGEAPLQCADPDIAIGDLKFTDADIMDDSEDFFGSDGFNDDEFDSEAFEIEE